MTSHLRRLNGPSSASKPNSRRPTKRRISACHMCAAVCEALFSVAAEGRLTSCCRSATGTPVKRDRNAYPISVTFSNRRPNFLMMSAHSDSCSAVYLPDAGRLTRAVSTASGAGMEVAAAASCPAIASQQCALSLASMRSGMQVECS